MTTQLLAKISPSQKQAAIDRAKNKPQNIEEMAEGDLAIFEISQTWRKTEDWVMRFLATTFLITLTVLGGFNMQDHANHERVRITRTRREKEI